MTEHYKKAHGNNSFAILLQMTESNLFIDLIKKELDRLGFDITTKHDSILCPVSQKDEIEKVIKRILDEELGKYELSIEFF